MTSRHVSRTLLVLGFIGLAACDRSPSATQPPLAQAGPRPQLSMAAIAAVNADRELMRVIARDAARDGIRNANKWFGDSQHRNRETICRGLARLIDKYMARYDEAKGRVRSVAERAAEAGAAARGTGCGAPAPMMLFGRSMALTAPSPVMADSADLWLADNWRAESWSQAIQSHAENDGGAIEPYIRGMTSFEIANFEAVACAQNNAIADMGAVEAEEGGEDPMMMFFLKAWAKAMLAGCAVNVLGNVGDIVGGARAGFFLWGPWGAAGAAAAVAAEHCLFGAIAGYVGYKIAAT